MFIDCVLWYLKPPVNAPKWTRPCRQTRVDSVGAKETQCMSKRDLLYDKKRPSIGAKETQYRSKRDLVQEQKRPTLQTDKQPHRETDSTDTFSLFCSNTRSLLLLYQVSFAPTEKQTEHTHTHIRSQREKEIQTSSRVRRVQSFFASQTLHNKKKSVMKKTLLLSVCEAKKD